MMIKIQVGLGLRKVINMISRLPKTLQKEIGAKGSREIAKSGQRRIVYRYNVAGYHGKGHGLKSLKKPMTFKQSGNSYIYTLAIPDYLGLIEKGMPSHYVSVETIKQHLASPGSTTGKRQPEGTIFAGPPVWWQYKGPFISPALKALESDIPKILEKATARAIAGAAK